MCNVQYTPVEEGSYEEFGMVMSILFLHILLTFGGGIPAVIIAVCILDVWPYLIWPIAVVKDIAGYWKNWTIYITVFIISELRRGTVKYLS